MKETCLNKLYSADAVELHDILHSKKTLKGQARHNPNCTNNYNNYSCNLGSCIIKSSIQFRDN